MSDHVGRLEVVCGCMFSGKTTELIRRLVEARGAGASVVAVKPRRDTRYASERIVAHTGESFAATAVDGVEQIPAAAAHADVVGIDEVHFFDAALCDVCQRLVATGCRVIAAGVDVDHRGKLFPAVASLLDRADDTTRHTARCARCGGVAEYSQRLIDSDEPIVVGGADLYEPRCRTCFAPPQ